VGRGCLLASYAERRKIGLTALLATALIGGASWWASQWQYHLTPGTNLVFREASNAGAWAGLMVFVAAAIPGLAAAFAAHDGKFHEAARAGRICAVIAGPYRAALVLVSLTTPGTLVNIGDSYCYDLWCVGINQVKATPGGHETLYTAEVRIFTGSTHPHRLPAAQAKDFFYVLDDQGRRYPLLKQASFVGADVTVQPGEPVKSSLAFRGQANVRKLYLMGEAGGTTLYPPWVYLYFGSDISLFHRRALLRIL
jgi:hypothetical protein